MGHTAEQNKTAINQHSATSGVENLREMTIKPKSESGG